MTTQKIASPGKINTKELLALLKDYREIGPFLPYLGSIALALILFFAFVFPKINQTLSLRADNNRQEEEIRKLSQKLADIEGMAEADISQNAALLLEALPEDNDFYRLLNVVKSSFAENGVFLEYFDLSPGELGSGSASLKKGSWNSLSVKVGFAASFENYMRLLSALEKSLPLIEVSSVKFKTFTISEETSRVDGEMTLVGYYQPLPATLGKVSQPLVKVSGPEANIIEELKSYRRYVSSGIISSESVLVGKEYPFPF